MDFNREDVDASVMIGQKNNDELDYTFLFSTDVFPVCSPLLLKRSTLLANSSDLSQHTILQVYPSRRDWVYWLDNLQLSHIDPDSGLIFDSYDHALSAAREGVGVPLAMQPYVARDLHAGTLVEPFPSQRVRLDRDWYFVCRKARSKEPKIRAFRTWLQDEIAADPEIETDPGKPV